MKNPLPARSHRTALLLTAVVAVVVLVTSESAYWQSGRWMQTLDATAAAQADLRALLIHLGDADVSQRSYLLTGRDDQLQACRAALASATQVLQRLATYYRAAEPAGDVGRLEAAVQARRADIESTLDLYAAGERERAIGRTVVDRGREQIITIHQLAAELSAVEAGKQAQARARVDRTLLFGRIGVDALAAVSLLALVLYLRQTQAIEALRARRSQEIQAERDQLEREVKRRTAQLSELARHLQSAREDERRRLARELHDELGALLTAAKLDAARIRARLGAREPEAIERLAHLIQTLNDGIALKRRIIEDLRPSSLDNLGLVAALEILAREFGQTAKVAVQCRLQTVELAASAQLTVFRLVQEAFTNIAKYARARRVDVNLAARAGVASIEVADDGVGFDADAQPPSAHGLLGMRYRVEAEGGTLAIETAPGRGTRIRASIPEQRPA